MATPDELRAAIKVGREALARSVEAAGEHWEQHPEGAEGEEAWSPRQVAEHVIGSEIFFATAICEACGYPGPESPFAGELSLATPQDALTALAQATEAAHAKIKYVTEEDLAHPHERLGNVESTMAFEAFHLLDHAMQIRAASR